MNALIDWEDYERKNQRVLWLLAILMLAVLGVVIVKGAAK